MNPCACGCGRQVAPNKKGKRYFNGACRAEHSRYVQREKLKAEIREEVLRELAPRKRRERREPPDRRHRTHYDDETYRMLSEMATYYRMSRTELVKHLIRDDFASLHGWSREERYAAG